MTYFIFDDVDSRSFGVYLFDLETDNAPARDYKEVIVPGRNGTLLMDNNRYPNIYHYYYGIIASDYDSNIAGLRSLLLSRVGYKRLEDGDHPDEFYLAYYRDRATVTTRQGRGAGKLRLTFERKPERYLKSGETTTKFYANGSIQNPTEFASKPLLRIYGKGTVGLGDGEIIITDSDEYIDIDCEAMECYKEAASMNGMVSFTGADFPVLKPGNNGVRLGTGITRVDVTPRWWRL